MANTNSLQFNGSTQYGRKDGPSNVFGVTNITLELWFRREATSSGQTMLAIGTVAGNTETVAFLRLDGSDKLVGRVASGATAYSITSTTTISASVWYHAALVYNGSDIKLYLGTETTNDAQDATPVSASGTLNTPSAGQDSMYVGAIGITNETDIGNFFTGYVDEVRVWNIARSQQSINNDRAKEITAAVTGLVTCYHFSEGSGTTVADITSSANNLTLTGTPTWSSTIPVWKNLNFQGAMI